MKVEITIEHSQYRLVGNLKAINSRGNIVNERQIDELREKKITRNEALVKTLLIACRRLNQGVKMEIVINTTNTYVKSCLRSLEKWQQSDWITSKGKVVTHKEEWKEIYELTKNFKVEVEDGKSK